MYGRRIAAFHIGKECRLMYSWNGVFTTSDLLTASEISGFKNIKLPNIPAVKEGVKDTTVILTPFGDLLAISVPFPCLLRYDD